MKAEENTGPHGELDVAAVFVMLLLHVILGLQEALPDFTQEHVALLQLPIHCCNTGETRGVRHQSRLEC
jgi:hypothetical protein